MAQDNHFVYQKSRHLDQVTLLQASMSDFTYGKHAHEEYSFGITLTGRQDFSAVARTTAALLAKLWCSIPVRCMTVTPD